jgi:diguanylate cyclase (GGDEF)-like protein
MIICASPDMQDQLQPWLEQVQDRFSRIEDLNLHLHQRLLPDMPPVPIFLDFSCLDPEQSLSAQISRLHVLSAHQPILIAAPHQLDSLSDAAVSHLYAVLSLPMGARNLQMILAQLQSEAERHAQMAAHEQRLVQLMEENRRLRMRLQQESVHDPLTGLYHRRAFEERLHDEWRRAHRHGHPLTMIAIRMRGLESTPNMDAFVSELAHRFEAVRSSDIVARLEPDLFVLLLPLTFQEGAQALTAHFRAMAQKLIEKHALIGVTPELISKTEIPRRHSDSSHFLSQLIANCCASPGREMLMV